MTNAKKGELKSAARRLGVTSTVLRQHGWKTASEARIHAVETDPPEWLVKAQERRRRKQARRRARRQRNDTARRLGVLVRAVKERGVEPGDVPGLLAEPPDWLVAEQQRYQRYLADQAEERRRVTLRETLETAVHEVWLQELKRAENEAEVAEIDSRWAPEVKKARQEAARLAAELTDEQVDEMVARESASMSSAAVYRAQQIAKHAVVVR